MIKDSKIVKLLSIPKSFYVSWKLMGMKNAIRLPILVRYNTCIAVLKGKLQVENTPIATGIVSIGFCGSGITDKRYSRSIIEIHEGGRLLVGGKVCFGHGTKLIIGPNAHLYFGNGFASTAEGSFICFNKISIGAHTAAAWFSFVTDTDFHSVENTETGQVYAASSEIMIGERCWLGFRSITLRGTTIPNGCILAANSTAIGHYQTENTLLAGCPAVEKKYNVRKSTIGDFQVI